MASGTDRPHRTHVVENQSPPRVDVDEFATNVPLVEAVVRYDAGGSVPALAGIGRLVGGAEFQDDAVRANTNDPVLRAFDRWGNRIDEVDYDPAYHTIIAAAVAAGAHTSAWADPGPGANVVRAATFFLFAQVEPGHACPVSMSHAAVPTLSVQPDLAATWVPRLLSRDYDPQLGSGGKTSALVGMAMTEKQGGSDVRANRTVAVPVDGGGPGTAYRLTGHKWFCSAPMSDAFLTLAYTDAGVTCFLAPRWRPDGERNGIEIQRLKDKLGDRSNASSEIEYRGAWAERVGEEGRGVKTIIEMVGMTRLDCIIGSATQMRQACALAAWHCQGRTVFQKKLIDQPLMRAVLADLALDVEAATALAFRLAMAIDRSADPHEAALARIGLPLAKYLVTKRAPTVVAEAMECHGGAGYVEEGPMPRLFRQSPLNAIWEGSGNVIALDMIRALQREPETREALRHEIVEGLADNTMLRFTAGLADTMLLRSVEESQARRVIETLAHALAVATLNRFVSPEAADSYQTRRLRCGAATFGAGDAAIDENRLIERLALQT